MLLTPPKLILSPINSNIEGDFKAQFQTYLNQSINWLTTKDNSVTLENYNTVYCEVKNFSASLPADWLKNLHTLIRIPGNVSVDELRQIETGTKERLGKQFTEQYTAEMNGLFSEQASMQNYQPKVKVTQKIELLNPEGIMPILSMWWSKEGCTLSVEELSKLFKKQITFCEKLANKDSVYIENESVRYIDDVKAK